MKDKDFILLPGLDQQLNFLNQHLDISNLNILVIGSGSAIIAKSMFNEKNRVNLIVDEYESLLNANFELKTEKSIVPKLMDYESTDFQDNEFDLVYAQGSISNLRRKKIIKEIKRISKSEGHLCVGEIVKLSAKIPRYVKDIFDNSDLDPLEKNRLSQYYTDKDFTLIDTVDLSLTLKEYYEKNLDLLKRKMPELDKSEMSYYKKVLNQISHQSNAYLKLGGNNYIGFHVLLMRNIKK